MAERARAGYATNVRHYGHVLEAFDARWDRVDFLGPTEIDPRTLGRLKPILPSRVYSQLARRQAPALPPHVRRIPPNPAADLPSLKRMVMKSSVGAKEIVAIHEAQARRVARKFDGSEYLQTVEGIGFGAMRLSSARHIVVERRNLHHAAFEEHIETFAGFPFELRRDPIRDLLEEEYASADRIVVYSEVAKRSFLERGYDAAKIWVSPLPVAHKTTMPRSQAANDPFQILYVGRIDAYKGVDVAVAALDHLPEPYRLVVAGPGGAREREWLSRQRRVDYRGVVSKSELARLFAESAVLVAPSIESFGLAILEATTAGLTVLTRETTGVSDYLPAGSFGVVPTRDPEQWAEAILLHRENPRRVVVPDLDESPLAWSSAVSNQSALMNEVLG